MRKALTIVAMVGFVLGLAPVAQARPGDATREFVLDAYCGEHYVAGQHVFTSSCEQLEEQIREDRAFVCGDLPVNPHCRRLRERLQETKHLIISTYCRTKHVPGHPDEVIWDPECESAGEELAEIEAFVIALVDDTDVHSVP